MCGDAEIRCKCNLDVRKMGPAVDSLRGVMVVSSYDKVDFRCGVGGELMTVMRDVVTLRDVCDMIAGRDVERLLKCV